jgi:hypothetical protein
MGKETIDAAIVAHRGWVSRFKTAFEGINTEHFELDRTVDHSACDLGRWLRSDDSVHLLGRDSHDRINVLHERFHQICGALAVQLNQRQGGLLHQEPQAELDTISKAIVAILIQARDAVD